MHRADDLLREARKLLTDHGIAAAALDARLLLQAIARLRHEQLVADPTLVVNQDCNLAYQSLIWRRCRGEPVSRLLGLREFMGLDFEISPDVLDPRPETEHLVQEAINTFPHGSKEGRRFLDLGTGSGAIAICLALEWPEVTGVAVDASARALDVARRNASHHKVSDRISFIQSDWFQNVDGLFDVIVSNPPYIRHADIPGLERDVRDFDPHLALDGGADGLQCYRIIALESPRFMRHGARVLVEIGHDQEDDVTAIFKSEGYRLVRSFSDYSGHVRGIIFDRHPGPDT
jgi:release factor glutamine methyltransferase